MPALSLICGNVRLCLSMNPWKSLSSPVHATPTKLTSPANFFAAASTEGASRLQLLQVGAQNQNSVGLPANVAASISPPPTSGAVNCSEAGAVATSSATSPAGAVSAAGTSVDGDVSMASPLSDDLSDDPPPHALSNKMPAAMAERRPEARIRATVPAKHLRLSAQACSFRGRFGNWRR
jgi:hypothetical protein